MSTPKPRVIDPHSQMAQAFAKVGVVRHNTEVLREQAQLKAAQARAAQALPAEQSFRPVK